ncbi:MAG TPA: 2OG-Fe(II) oxygenase family protein [Acetobacteraceae bacterium]
MTSAIPVIDVADYLSGRPGALQATAGQVHDALTTVGFLVLTGHDVPQPLMARTFGEAKRLHELPMADKLALRLNEHNNGYMAMGRYAVWTSDVNRNDKPDLNEAFFIKRERSPDDPLRRSGRRFVGANVWPDRGMLPEFRRRALDYADTMDAFARRMLPAVAVALDLPPDWFDEAFRQSQFTLRLSHYPPVPAAANQFGIAPHTDSSFMTFLAQTEVPGLQVRMASGEWLDVPFIPGSFAVNSGDMMQRWTNGRFKSTPHRALPPVGCHRYAIPFFLGPRFDQVIACLPTCRGPDNPPRWEPITYSAWQEYWYDANYDPKVQKDLVA